MEGWGFYLSPGGLSVTVADLEPSGDYGEVVPCNTTPPVSQKPQAVKCSFPQSRQRVTLLSFPLKLISLQREEERTGTGRIMEKTRRAAAEEGSRETEQCLQHAQYSQQSQCQINISPPAGHQFCTLFLEYIKTSKQTSSV